jgi:hypothetical protein
MRPDASVSPVWRQAYEADPKGIQAGWRAVLGPLTFPRDVLIQLPKSRDPKTGRTLQGRYDATVNTFQEYGKLLLQNAPRRDCWVGWGRPRDYDLQAMHMAFGDVDSPRLEEALTRARRYEEFAMTEFGVQPAPLFSCGKGFHCLFSHDEVPYRGSPYSDAMLQLSDPYRVYLDPGPLKHRKAKPRVPYSINLKATGERQAPMFVVPVDLSWDLPEILQAARECRVTPFQVPHSADAAALIEPLARKAWEKRQRAAKRRLESGGGVDMDRIQDIVTFCTENGPCMVDGRGRPDGRRRMLYAMLVPALMYVHQGDVEAVLEASEAWVLACKGSWMDYEAIVQDTVKNAFMDDGSMRQPMSVQRWLSENPGLRFPHS